MAPLQRSKSAAQADRLQIQHFTHQHLLHKLYMTSEFNCDGCNTGGYGVRYRCSACDFDLHEQCATSPHRISSHLHPHQQLILVNRPGESRLCLVCKGFTNGLSYTCECQNQTCEFNVHPLCIQVPVATGVPSVTLDPSQQPDGVSWGHPTTGIGGCHGESANNQPVMINQQQQMQGIPTTAFGGYNGISNCQEVMVNHHHSQTQKQGIRTTVFAGNNLVSNSQPVMINHHQQQQGIPTVVFDGYHGLNNSQPLMVNHQQKEGMPTTELGGYHGVNNNQTRMMNYQQPLLPQGIPMTAFGAYQRGNNSQVVSVNQQQQQQGIPTTGFSGYHGMNTNQQMMINHNQQQQQQGISTAAIGHGYTVVNNNQNVMINHQQHPQQQQQPQLQPVKSNNYSKVGKIAANILTTSLIGVPIFRN